MPTASDDVWEAYISVSALFIPAFELLTSLCQSHPEAKPFRKKSFPLYDDLATLIDDVVATGSNAFGNFVTAEGVARELDENSEAGDQQPVGADGQEESSEGAAIGDAFEAEIGRRSPSWDIEVCFLIHPIYI
jgi:hypothetical protein